MSIIAWLVLCGSVLWMGVVAHSIILATRMAKHHQAGSEFIPLVFLPLYLLAPLAGIAGALAGFWLAWRTGSTAGRIVLYVAGGVLAAGAAPSLICVMMAWAALSMVSPRRQAKFMRAHRRLISQEEMIKLIRSRAIRSFTRESGSVRIEYVSGRAAGENGGWPPDHADPAGFGSYVDAALELAPGFIVEFNDKDAPPESMYRWIAAEEAEDLLERGMIKTFNYGTRRFPEIEPASGRRTGIKLADYGWVRHLYVEPSMEDTMVPVARAVQRSHHGVPQFCINGIYEPVTDHGQG